MAEKRKVTGNKPKKGERFAAWDRYWPARSDKAFWNRWHRARVFDHYDGDTFVIMTKNRGGVLARIRLADYHAPELNRIGGCTAKALLQLILPKKQTIYYKPSVPNYNRLVARVRKNGIEVNKVLSRTRITAKRNDNYLCPTKKPPKATWPKKK